MATKIKEKPKPPLSRYSDSFAGHFRERGGQRTFVPNPNFGRGQRGTPLGRIEEQLRATSSEVVTLLWGDLDDSLRDAPADHPTIKKFRALLDGVKQEVSKLNNDPQHLGLFGVKNHVTREIGVNADDLTAVINLLTAPAE